LNEKDISLSFDSNPDTNKIMHDLEGKRECGKVMDFLFMILRKTKSIFPHIMITCNTYRNLLSDITQYGLLTDSPRIDFKKIKK